MMTIRDAIAVAAEQLAEANIEEPRLTAHTLLAHALGKDRAYLFAHGEMPISPETLAQFQRATSRRARRVPLQYLTGHQEFYGLDFLVTPDVLIPRPETELIVEEVLKLNTQTAPVIIDVGTGSGCLAVTLAVKLEQAYVIAVDISRPALDVARRNAGRHGVESRIEFFESDLFSVLAGREPPLRANFIVANPPYVSETEFGALPREVRDHEPLRALVAGPDGLAVHKRLLAESRKFLRDEGYLIVEMGFGQWPALLEVVNAFGWCVIEVLRDLQDIQRTMVLRPVEGG
jgi:release factor glutamine methyltransferase